MIFRAAKTIGRAGLLIGLLVGVGWLPTGCVSRRDTAYAKILKELESEAAKPAASSQEDVPDADRPDSLPGGLPMLRGDAGLPGGGGPLTIQPDCLVHISVEEDPGLDGSYPVNEIGAVQLSYIGPVILFNKTEAEAERKIEEVLKRRDFRNATVKVRIQRASYDKIRVDGAVNQRGLIQIGAGDAISLNDALLRAGGLAPTIRGAKVRVVRGGLTNALASALPGEVFSLVTEEGKPTIPSVSLRNNDVAYVFSSESNVTLGMGEKEILVVGEVNKPGVYRFTGAEPCSMMHLLFKMGGLPLWADRDGVKIIRRDEDGSDNETVIDVDEILKDGNPDKDVPLENGDRVVVPARRITLF